MQIVVRDICVAILILGLSACGRSGPRQEVIDKLRTLGVSANPVASEASLSSANLRTVELTVYAALPLGKTATITPYRDSVVGTGVLLDESSISVKAGSEAYTDLNGIRIFTAKATVPVPTVATLAKFGQQAFPVKYGFHVANDQSSEDVVGTFMVYPSGAPELQWKSPTVDISAPTDGSTIGAGKVDLTGQATTSNAEDLKIAWFATKGQIGSRRAKETTWTVDETGDQTLIMTAHGVASRGFAIKFVKVTTR